MSKSFLVACLFQAALISIGPISAAHAAGPFGTIHVGAWNGGAYTDDNTGNFSHCAAGSEYASGVSLVVSQTASNAWLLGFGSTAFHFTKGDTLPIDVTFDGQSQAKLFATANSTILISAILPPNVARTFQKSSLMVAVARGTPLQFNLNSTGPLIAALLLGVVDVAGKYYVPQIGSFVIYAAMVLLLLLFPSGLVGRRT